MYIYIYIHTHTHGLLPFCLMPNAGLSKGPGRWRRERRTAAQLGRRESLLRRDHDGARILFFGIYLSIYLYLEQTLNLGYDFCFHLMCAPWLKPCTSSCSPAAAQNTVHSFHARLSDSTLGTAGVYGSVWDPQPCSPDPIPWPEAAPPAAPAAEVPAV